MKDFNFFESAIIGFLVGIVASTYILFVASTGRFVGNILNFVALSPLINFFPIQYQDSIIFKFIFYILVFIIYAVIINLLFGISKKINIMITLIIVLLLSGIGFQQKKVFETPGYLAESSPVQVNYLASTQQKIKKYFGNEAVGDLNNDNKEDVAFIMVRNDGDNRGDMYYLSSSLKTDDGYNGTNIIFVGEKITIEKITIENQTVSISYKDNIEGDVSLENNSKTFLAKVVEGKIQEIKESIEEEKIIE